MNRKDLSVASLLFLSCAPQAVSGGFLGLFQRPLSFSNTKVVYTESTKEPKKREPHTREQHVLLHTEDGLTRKAILTTQRNAKGNVVLCHAAAYNKSYMKPYEKQLFAEYNCIRFDFRRHGEISEGQYSTIGKREAHEVRAAVHLLQNHEKTKKLPIYGFGISMGAAALLEAERQKPTFDGLILQSCYEKLRNQVRRMYSFYRLPFMHNFIFRPPSTFIARKRYNLDLVPNDPSKTIRQVNTPLFLIHARNDAFTPFLAFKRLCREAREKIVMSWAPPDGKHTNILKTFPKTYAAKVKTFFSSIKKSKEKQRA